MCILENERNERSKEIAKALKKKKHITKMGIIEATGLTEEEIDKL